MSGFIKLPPVFLLASALFVTSALLVGVFLSERHRTSGWDASLIVWQATMLAGCVYALVINRWLGSHAQMLLHAGVLALSLAVWFFAPLPDVDADSSALVRVAVKGWPFFAVVGSIPLLQRWFADTSHPERSDPYFFNSAVALGGIVGLSVGLSAAIWPFPAGLWPCVSVMTFALQMICIVAIWHGSAPARAEYLRDRGIVLTILRCLGWTARSAIAMSLALGMSTYVSAEIVPIPGLFYVVAVVYLFAFGSAWARTSSRSRVPLGLSIGTPSLALIVLFFLIVLPALGATSWEMACLAAAGMPTAIVLLLPWRPLALVQPVLVLALLGMLPVDPWPVSPLWICAAHLLVFALTVRVLFAAMVQDRPPVSQLPEFFLWIAAGGLIGALMNIVVAPLLFTTVVEYSLALVLSLVLWPLGEMRRYLARFASDPYDG